MKLYGQRGEDEYILKYFQGQMGKFLDIGAYHPTDKSNVRALYEMGWKGTLIEPAPNNFPFLNNHYSDDHEIEVLPLVIGLADGETTFYDSGGDAVSTTDLSHKAKWEAGWDVTYTEHVLPMVTFNTLLESTLYKNYEFINLDVEGTNWDILQTIDPHKVGCKMICVEFDNKKKEITAYLNGKGFSKYHETAENLIFVM